MVFVLAAATLAVTAQLNAGPASTPAPAQAQQPASAEPFSGPGLSGQALADAVARHVRRAFTESEADGDVAGFYHARGYQPAWASDGGLEALREFARRAESARFDGLPPARYPSARWRRLLAEGFDTVQEIVDRDVEITRGVLRLAHDLAHGPENDDPVRPIDVPRILARVSDGASARGALDSLEPVHAEYHALRRALRAYLRAADEGGWPALPADLFLQLPEEGRAQPQNETRAAVIHALCDRLRQSNELASVGDRVKPAPASSDFDACGFVPGEPPAYNPVLERAVRRFQDRHGLVIDGIVGPRTVAALNRTADHRAAQIAANMNRWRRLPDDLGERHVFVNVPAFRLEARAAGRAVLTMKVVAGEPDWQTPVMRDRISYLEFNPYWNVPRSITEHTLLPAIQSNPGYLESQGFEVIDGWSEPARVVDPATIDWDGARRNFPYRLRQKPGPKNALGLVKFMFPNEYAVYLHDTPADHRFEERRRAFSHGCVRVEQPVALADFLLGDDWTPGAIRDAMNAGRRQIVDLPAEVPVYLMYFTAWVNDGEGTRFAPDVYGRDPGEQRALGLKADTD